MNTNSWHAHVLTLFPEMFPGTLGHSLAGRALENKLWQLTTHDIRTFAMGKHASVDDIPYGGGAGMVLKPDVVDNAIKSLPKTIDSVIYLSPRGRLFDQEKAKKLANLSSIALLCGRYEGIDERVLNAHDVEELSIGDYVLSGGEIAAQVVIDACVRLLPGVVGSEETLCEESFESGLLEYPHYTRPQEWAGQKVPDVLLSGHHEEIKTWRRKKAEETTQNRRPDLWRKYKKTNKIN